MLMKHLMNKQGYLSCLQLNEYETQYYRKCEDQAAEGKYRPFINTIASCCQGFFDSMIEHLRTVEVKKKDKEKIRPETMVDVSYVFDLVLDNTKYIQDMRKINSPNDVRSLQSLVSNIRRITKRCRKMKDSYPSHGRTMVLAFGT